MAETILVVEDERLVAADLQRTLQALGYRVPVTVASGEEALVQADRLRPQLVLMDIHLKGVLDGIATARLLYQRLGLPVVFLTAYGDEDHVRRAKDAHPFGYLLKPFNERELRSTIEVALHKHAAERELRAQRRWYAATLRAIGDAVLTVDGAGRVSLLNAAAEGLTGWSEADALGRPVAEVLRLVREHGREPLEGLVEGVLAGGAGGPPPGPVVLLAREGTEVPVDATVAPIPAEGGGASEGVVVVFRDVRPQRRMQQQLALNDRLIALGTLAAGVAHEINNPLSYAHHNLAFLQRELAALFAGDAPVPAPGPDTLQEWREAVGDLREGMTRIQRIVEDLRVFGRAERGEELELLDVNVALERALKLTHHTLESRAHVERAVGEALPRVRGVEGRLTQVFVNLLVNAAQALPAGPRGQNRVRVTSRRVGGGGSDGDWVEVAVRDNGPGIPEAVRRHIFEPFFTTKAVGQGTGLGLSISHGIITRLGGRLEVDSEPGRGAEFRVLLPVAQGEGAVRPTPGLAW